MEWKMECISEGDMVLVQKEKSCRTFVLKKGRKLNLEKLSFYPDNAFGCHFGSSFQVEKQQLVPVSSAGRWKFGGSSETLSGSDNRDIMDDGASQELTEENITEMKGQGASGKEIVDSMIEHSSTFKVRTKFSQEKYIKKKERKYVPVIRILRTTTKLLCEMYHDRAPSKTCFLRSDALAQILSLSNVHARSNLLVMETTQGLLTGAMLERMGGYGKLVQVFYGDFPVRNILESFGHLSKSDKSILMKYPFHRIGSLLTTEEAQCSSIIRDTLASKTEGEGQGSRLWLVQRNEEELSKQAETEQGGKETSGASAVQEPGVKELSSSQNEAMETGATYEQNDKERNSQANCEAKSNNATTISRESQESLLQTVDTPSQQNGISVMEPSCSESAKSAVSLPSVRVPKYVKRLVWRGKMAMYGIDTFTARAYAVSGRTTSLSKILPTKIEVIGRILPENVWTYVEKLKTSKSREVALVHFEPGSKHNYSHCYTLLFRYLISRDRYGVVSTGICDVKDFYIVPLNHGASLPTQLLPLNGPGLPPGHADTLLGIVVRKKSNILSADDQTTMDKSDHVTTAHHGDGDSEDSEKEQVKISDNVTLLFTSVPSSTAMVTSLSHSHSETSITDSELLATSSSISHSQRSLLSFTSGSTPVSHSDSQNSFLGSEPKLPEEELYVDLLNNRMSSSDSGFVSTDDSSSSQELTSPGAIRPHPLPLLLNKTDSTHLHGVTEPLAITSNSDDQPSAITLEEGGSMVVTSEAMAPISQDVALPQSSNGSEPFVAYKVKSEDDKKVEDVDGASSGGDKMEDSATSTGGLLYKEEQDKEEILPQAKKAKLTTTDDGSGKDVVNSLEQTKDSTESEGTEHAQSDVVMDTDLPDKRCEGQDRQCGERAERKRAKEEAYKEAEDLLRLREMDGLVVVSRFHPEPVLMSLIHFVAPSRPVVVYCNILEPLVQCYKSLKDSGHTFSIQISETWTRHYQVLPERTHPEMSMDCRSGYILYTTKIQK